MVRGERGEEDDGSLDSEDVTRISSYISEDFSPTSDQELKGWYAYGVAAEIFAVCGVGSFLPITLEALARDNGVLFSDHSVPCIPPVGQESARLAMRATSRVDKDQCSISFLGGRITTSSFAMYTFSVAVLTQALVLVSMGSLADHGTNRKRLLMSFAFIGSSAAISFLFVVPSLWFIAPLLAIVGVVSLGCANVMLNSFLPLLVENHPSLCQYNYRIPDREKNNAAMLLSNQISSKGIGFGYMSAVAGQVLSIMILLLLNKVLPATWSASIPPRVIVAFSGFLWLVLSTPAMWWIRNRPGPPLLGVDGKNGIRRSFAYIHIAWTQFFRTVKAAAQLRQTLLFLIAWFLLSDAAASVSGTAILFARTELKLGSITIACLSILAMAGGIAGAFCWPILSRRYGWKTNRTIVLCMCLSEAIPVYGLLGYVPFIQRLGFGGLQQWWEIFPLGVIHGFVMGGLSSYCRSYFGRLIPPGKEAAFYSLFAVTDKGSSAVGPAIVGRIVDVTGHIRPAFFFLVVLIALPTPLIWFNDAEIGHTDAVNMANREKGRHDEVDQHMPEESELFWVERSPVSP